MINNRRVIAVVPARGGSRGVPGKNLRIVGGQSLLHRTLLTARASKYLDGIIVSSDDDHILEHASQINDIEVLRRPADLATDESAMAPVVEHVLLFYPADIVVLLQPTSPLRQTTDIDGALEKLVTEEATSVVSVCPARTSPHWMYHLVDGDRLQALLPKPEVATRQELPQYFQVNGALYAVDVAWFSEHKSFVNNETVAFVMPGDRSIDVDTPEDLDIAEALLLRQRRTATSADK